MDKIRHKGRFCRSGLFSKMKNLKQFSVKGGDTVTVTDTGNLQAGDSSKSMTPPPPHIEEKEGINWKTGRRIVELGVLSEGLDKKGCMACGNILQLSNIVQETQSGLANYLKNENSNRIKLCEHKLLLLYHLFSSSTCAI